MSLNYTSTLIQIYMYNVYYILVRLIYIGQQYLVCT